MIKKFLFILLSISIINAAKASCKTAEDCEAENDICKPASGWGTSASCFSCTGSYPNADKSKNDCYKIEQLKKIYQDSKNQPVCVDYATSSNGNCTCSANYTANNGNTACDPKVYKLTLHPNCENSTQSVCLLTAKKTGYVQYNVGYSLKPKGPFDSKTVMPFGTRNNFTFGGYYTTENLVYGTQVFKADGKAIRDSTCTSFTKDTDLYAKWIPNFSIHYTVKKDNLELCMKEVNCANNGCTNGAIQISQLTNCNLAHHFPAQTFSHWICNSKEVHPGDSIDKFVTDNVSEIIFCIAHFIRCPAGYYCQSNQKNPCPTGTTSTEGSSEITDCFVNGDTVFKDNAGSFSLPNVKIYYKQ